jgi:hypothetical protein
MKWLEIIHLRTNRRYLETLLRDLAGPIKATEPDKESPDSFRNPSLNDSGWEK